MEKNRRHKIVAFIDSGVEEVLPQLSNDVARYVEAHSTSMELTTKPLSVRGGEAAKNDLKRALERMRLMIENRLCRHSFVLAIGGGAVLDAVGFSASLVHRGLRLIRVPTTVLGQCDSGVGVKNALNLDGGKNLIGTFASPFAVLNDSTFLRALPDSEWIAGIAEAFKVAIIKDATFFRWLCRHAATLRQRDIETMEYMVRQCAILHLDHIRSSGDPFEQGQARPLDFGHWAAHKIEGMSEYRVGHGEAVAIGVALDSHYAMSQGWLTLDEFRDIITGLRNSGFRLWSKELGVPDRDGNPEILGGLRDFREHLGGELLVTMPRGIGQRFEVDCIEPALVEKAVQCLEQFRQP
jgi:3-dehydroquinate synthase